MIAFRRDRVALLMIQAPAPDGADDADLAVRAVDNTTPELARASVLILQPQLVAVYLRDLAEDRAVHAALVLVVDDNALVL